MEELSAHPTPPRPFCTLTQFRLRQEYPDLRIWNECPICALYGVTCNISYHPGIHHQSISSRYGCFVDGFHNFDVTSSYKLLRHDPSHSCDTLTLTLQQNGNLAILASLLLQCVLALQVTRDLIVDYDVSFPYCSIHKTSDCRGIEK